MPTADSPWHSTENETDTPAPKAGRESEVEPPAVVTSDPQIEDPRNPKGERTRTTNLETPPGK